MCARWPRTRKTSANRVLIDLIETGLEAKKAEKERFFDLAQRFKECSDAKESEHLRETLARMIFGSTLLKGQPAKGEPLE